MSTINKRWFKNRLKAGELSVRCVSKQTDDYAFDAAMNFFSEKTFKDAEPNLLTDWYIDASHIYGEKEGIINVCFANCEYWEFKLKK